MSDRVYPFFYRRSLFRLAGRSVPRPPPPPPYWLCGKQKSYKRRVFSLAKDIKSKVAESWKWGEFWTEARKYFEWRQLLNYGNNLQGLADDVIISSGMELRGKKIQRNSLLLRGINSGMMKVRTDNPSGPTWPGLRMSLKYFSKAVWKHIFLLPVAKQYKEMKTRGESQDTLAETDFFCKLDYWTSD